LRALKRRLTIAVGAAVLAALVFGTAAWFLVPRAKYKAQAVLHVAAQPPRVLFGTVETQERSGGEEYARYQKTQMAWVRSRLVLNTALQQPAVQHSRMVQEQEDTVRWLQKELDVHFEAGSELMNIGFSGDQPEELAALVNAVKDAYMEEVVNAEHKRRMSRFDKLRKLKEKYQDQMKVRRQELRKLAESAGTDDRQALALKQQFATEHLASVKRELLEIESQKRRYQAALKMQQLAGSQSSPEAATHAVSEADVIQAIEQDPYIIDLQHQLAQARQKQESVAANAQRIARRGSDPSVKYWRDQVNLLAKSLDRQRESLRPMVIRQLQNQEGSQKESRGDETRQQLAMLEDVEQRLNAEIQRLNEGNHSLARDTVDLQGIQDELVEVQEAATKVAHEVEALTVELEAPPRVRLLENAVVPISTDDQKRYLMIGLITLGSFFGGLFGIAFLELQSQKVDTAEAVSVDMGLQIVGALPLVPAKARRSGSLATQPKDRYWYSLLLESVDATRTMLLYTARASGYRVVMIGSAESGEGKTTLATHLATSLGRTGLKTLLIDADLRCPTIHRLFDAPPEPGLSELLRGEAELEDVIAPTPVEDLQVIVAGKYDQAAIRILAQGGLGAIFARLKERFDFVILDSSPLLPVADGLMIAQQVDALVFSILRDVSRKTKVYAAYERLAQLGVPILGAVVTGAFGGAYGYGYYGHSYGYGRPVPARASSNP
jgi:capsular exopolysaccharide synthesis family protein